MQAISLNATSRILMLAVFTLGLSTPSVQATILPFTITPTPANDTSFETVLPDYGDNVSSTSVVSGSNTYTYLQGNGFTPDIAVTYSHTASGGNLGHHTYKDAVWTNPVDYLYAFIGSQHFITFTPTAPFGVQLNSFLIDTYSSPSNRIDWNIRDLTTSGTILATGFETGLSGGANRTVNLGGLINYNTTVLEIILTDVTGGHVSIDDVNFDQALPPVPEPSTLTLLGLGAVGLAVRTRRRRVA